MELVNEMFARRIIEEEQTRLAAYKRGWQYYRGEHKKMLAVKYGKPDDNVTLNLSKLIVDKGVSFLFGKEIEFQIEEGTQNEQEDYLAEVWDANRKMSLLGEVALNGGICGHAFIKIIPRDGLPTRLVNLDPAIVRPFWNPDDIRDVLYYKIEYEALSKEGQVFKKQIIERNEQKTAWTITNYEKKNEYRDYQQVGAPEIWQYEFPPILDWQNLPAPNEYFGTSDLDDGGLNDAVNFTASNINRILRYHAHPRTWGKGFKAKDIEIGADEMVVLPNENATLENLEMQSSLEASIKYLELLTGWYMRISRVPNLDPNNLSVGALSGFALKILYGELLEKTETKRRCYGDAIVELNRRLLILGGKEEAVTRIHWSSPLPENKAEQAGELKVEKELGTVSQETMATELGRDWQTEQERLAAEAMTGNSIGAQLLSAFNRGEPMQNENEVQ